ncbi:MAG: hypothetical protein M3N19_07285 [Candidatus Eremiobacteraeota bacterium]|nr:hypothetical protein [Candidatus Eremiobacteraeota bacterium]
MALIKQRFIASAVCIAAFLAAVPALALPSGPVVVAKTSGKGLLLWQATLFINELLSKHDTDRALSDVESAALTIVASRRAQFSKANTISIRVLTTRVADTNNKAYAPTSFAGFEQLLVVNVTKSALADSAKWPKQVDPLHLPAGVTVDGASTFKI